MSDGSRREGKRPSPQGRKPLGLGAKVLVGMMVGVVAGLILKQIGISEELTEALAIPGDVFIGAIKMVVVPLVLVAVTLGIAGNDDIRAVQKLGVVVVAYFLTTTAVAVTLGAVLAVAIQPGKYIDASFKTRMMANADPVSVQQADLTLREQVQGLLPKGLFFDLTHANMLQIVILAALFGAAILVLKERSDPIGVHARNAIGMLEFFQELLMRIVLWALQLAPIGVAGIMANVTVQVGLDAITSVAAYSIVVLMALFGLFIFYGIIVAVIGRRSPTVFYGALRELQVMAFSTSSSVAVMPLSLTTAERGLGVHPSVSRFIVPLGATINMDGTAAYQAVAALFLMQVFGVPVTPGSVALVLGTSILASIGTPGTPGVGIVVLAGILESNGVPGAGIALIFGVDRLLDMCRTTVNVTGDQAACIVMERLTGEKLRELSQGELGVGPATETNLAGVPPKDE